MKHILGTLTCCCLLALPVQAQDSDAPSLMERGAQQFLEGLLEEMEPAFKGMRAFMDEMGPAMIELLEEVQDWSVYEAPEILDNGDIIIRRKPEEKAVPELKPEPVPQIEL